MISTLYLCGATNPEGVRLAIRINEREQRWSEIVLLDDDPEQLHARHLGVQVVGPISKLAGCSAANAEVVNLVARTSYRRRTAGERIAAYGVPWTQLIGADVDLFGARVAEDLIAYRNATIGAESRVGAGTVVFMGAIVGHGCHVGKNCIVAPNAVLNARVHVGDNCYIGSNAVVLPDISIGDNAVIGAAAVVVDQIPAGATVVGEIGSVMQDSITAAGAACASGVPGNAELRHLVVNTWCELLGVSRISAGLNFFDAGGTSLMAVQMAQRLEQQTGVSLCVIDVFHFPTIEQLTLHMSGGSSAAADPHLSEARLRGELRRELRGSADWRVAGGRGG